MLRVRRAFSGPPKRTPVTPKHAAAPRVGAAVLDVVEQWRRAVAGALGQPTRMAVAAAVGKRLTFPRFYLAGRTPQLTSELLLHESWSPDFGT
jgi:hypothetical protein